ncbi:MAG: amidohydrolase [Firmicutes bacterium]|nr:amidohydrolase [Bacillota bacterium]
MKQYPDFLRLAKGIEHDLIMIRRDIHQNPELGNEETRTSRLIAENLEKLGIEVKMGEGGIGVIGSFNVSDNSPVICLRADMDAIPVQENTGLPYESKVPGVMHACGHDIHCAVVLGAAEILSKYGNQLDGGVRFIFQPAEEIDLGAKAMLEQGVLEDPKPIGIFGLHVWPGITLGKVGIQSGAVMAAIDSFDVTFEGASAHGAEPHLGHDALLAASMSVVALQRIVSRTINPRDPAVITVGSMKSGAARNIIADSAYLSATVRTLDENVRASIKASVHKTISGCSDACDVNACIDYTEELPVLVNSQEMSDIALESAKRVLGENCITKIEPSMTGDDFALYAERIPGCYIFMGVTPHGHEIIPLHNPKFNPDEKVIPAAAAVLAHACWESLRQ